MRPNIYITSEPARDLLSIDQLRQNINHPHAAKLWQQIKAAADASLNTPPYTPETTASWRRPDEAKHGNRDYAIVRYTALRVMQNALTCLITKDMRYRDAALMQIETVFDEKHWPDWRDKAHPTYPADLRTGMFGCDLALTYNWLHPYLTDAQKQMILEGLDRRAIQPYLQTLKQSPRWATSNSNWMTDIVGGLGIAGMALGNDHPDASYLIEYSLPKMRSYLQMYGPKGEFNEAVGYANATRFPVGYFMAYHYYLDTNKNVLADWPFPQTCYWMMHLTFPPRRLAAFGDTNLDSKPESTYYAAVAAACQDSVLQWFYLHGADASENENKGVANIAVDPRELLWFDATLKPQEPAGRLPLGEVFPAYAGCVVSRTSWDMQSTPCAVYGKFSHEPYHRHDDAGQLCIDGYGEKLIIDLGKPTPYPKAYFSKDRYEYYIASTAGHNVFTFDNQNMDPDESGKQAGYQFSDQGAAWIWDLTAMYPLAKHVSRAIGFVHPGLIVVLDEAQLVEKCSIHMHWHLATEAVVDQAGRFGFSQGQAALAGQVIRVDRDKPTANYAMRRHAYQSPFDLDRLGEPMVQKNEPYLDVSVNDDCCRLLTLFAVGASQQSPPPWQAIEQNVWETTTGNETYTVKLHDDSLRIQSRNHGWAIHTDNTIQWFSYLTINFRCLLRDV